MKTTKQAFSGNPFVNIFRLTLANLQKKETVKRAMLVLFVLLCAVIRFSVLSTDKNLIKQNKQVSFSAENLNQPVWPSKLMLKNETDKKQLSDQLKTQRKSFNRGKEYLNLYLAN